jgi:PPM family protein phosphatase
MSNVKVFLSASTDVGMHRTGNEDAFMIADLTTGATGLGPQTNTHQVGARGSLLVVSDGMGGAAAGEVASELAVTTIRETLMEGPATDVPTRLREATESANERIWNHAQENPEFSGMGATVTAMLVQEAEAYIAQVGDSRAYLIRGERIKQLTKDQSLAQMLLDAGAILPEQAASVPQNVIMQALGTQPTVKVAMSKVQLCRNDAVLLCSDGLSNKVGPHELKQTVEQSADLSTACRTLIDLANERGGEDNITVVVARFDGEDLQTASETQSITGSLLTLSQDYLSDSMSEEVSNRYPEMNDPGATAMLSAIKLEDLEPDAVLPLGPEPEPAAEPEAASLEALPLMPAPPIPQKKQGYAGVVIAALLSAALIAGTLYFFYNHYMKSHAQSQSSEQPTPSDSPASGSSSGDQPQQ